MDPEQQASRTIPPCFSVGSKRSAKSIIDSYVDKSQELEASTGREIDALRVLIYLLEVEQLNNVAILSRG